MMTMGAADEAEQLKTRGGGCRVAQKQPVVATDRQRADALFRMIVVDRYSIVRQIDLQSRPLIPQVAQRLAFPPRTTAGLAPPEPKGEKQTHAQATPPVKNA